MAPAVERPAACITERTAEKGFFVEVKIADYYENIHTTQVTGNLSPAKSTGRKQGNNLVVSVLFLTFFFYNEYELM